MPRIYLKVRKKITKMCVFFIIFCSNGNQTLVFKRKNQYQAPCVSWYLRNRIMMIYIYQQISYFLNIVQTYANDEQ